jgi:outer membrane protein
VTKSVVAITGMALTMLTALPAAAQQKIGVIQVQAAIVGTKEGQKAAADLEARMTPKRKELETKQADLRRLQDQLQKGGSAMSDQARATLTREIDTKNKDYQRSLEDAQAEFQGEQDKLLNELGQKLLAVINKYAKDNAYSLVIDVSNPQTPVMFAADSIDITKEVVELYDRNTVPAAAVKPTAAPAAIPVKPAPTAAPATKK